MLVSRSLFTADDIQIIDGRAQTDLRCDCRRASFKLIRQIRVRRFFERHALDHVAATLKRIHLLQQPRRSVNNATTGRRKHLVPENV